MADLRSCSFTYVARVGVIEKPSEIRGKGSEAGPASSGKRQPEDSQCVAPWGVCDQVSGVEQGQSAGAEVTGSRESMRSQKFF